MFAGPMNPGAALIVKKFSSHISVNGRYGALSKKNISYFLWILILEGNHDCIICPKVTKILLKWCRNYSALRKCWNCNLIVESPKYQAASDTWQSKKDTMLHVWHTGSIFCIFHTDGLSRLFSWAKQNGAMVIIKLKKCSNTKIALDL